MAQRWSQKKTRRRKRQRPAPKYGNLKKIARQAYKEEMRLAECWYDGLAGVTY